MTYFKHLMDRGFDRADAQEITRKLRNRLAGNQNWRCCYCGKHMQFVRSQRHDFATLEHVVPITYGGTNGEDNLVVACAQCNTTRGHRFLDVHFELLRMYETGELV